MTRPKLQVNLKTFQRKWRIDPTDVRKYLRKVWIEICKAGGPPAKIRKTIGPGRPATATPLPVEVTVVLLNDNQIHRYNRDYRKKNYPTDVLSFPVNEIQDEMSSGHRSQIFYLGDILISMERTVLQASEKNHTPQREFKILLLHGILHLIGYDHEVDQGQMDRLERRLRKTVL
jgi:rRNA maturation RNase YbeY